MKNYIEIQHHFDVRYTIELIQKDQYANTIGEQIARVYRDNMPLEDVIFKGDNCYEEAIAYVAKLIVNTK